MSRGRVVQVAKVMPFSPPGLEGVYSSRMLLDVYNSGSENLQVNHGTLKAGCSTPGAVHEDQDEVYVVLRGGAILTLDQAQHEVGPGSVVFIPAGVFHALDNEGNTEDLEIITVWPGQPSPGTNEVYDMRQRAWGTTYREAE